jgi:hypothetical protein
MRKIYPVVCYMLAAIVILLFISCGGDDTVTYPLRIISEKLPDSTIGREYYFTLSAAGGTPAYRWKIQGKLPDGLDFDNANGIIRGIPVNGAVSSTFSVMLNDNNKEERNEAVNRFTLKVVSGPFIASESDLLPLLIRTETLPAMEVGILYKLYLTGSGGLPPYKWKTKGALPTGMTFDEITGLLSGRPVKAGRWDISVEMSDLLGNPSKGKRQIMLEVKPPTVLRKAELLPFEVITRKIPPAVVGQGYIVYLSVRGGLPPYIWKVTTGLPAGIDFDPVTARLSGTAEIPGKRKFSFNVIDSGSSGNPVNITYELEIIPRSANKIYPLKVLTDRLPTAVKGENYSFALSAQGGVLPYKWVAVKPLPAGMTLDTGKGVLGGMPLLTEEYSLQFELSDSQTPPAAVWRTYNLSIIKGNSSDGLLKNLIPWAGGMALALVLFLAGRTLRRNEGIRKYPLEISTDNLPPVKTGEAYFAVLKAKGGIRPYLWDNENKFPEELIVEGRTGIIKGVLKPTETRSFNLDLILYDSSSPPEKTYRSLKLMVKSDNVPVDKRVFTIIAKDQKIFFQGAPANKTYKGLLTVFDLERDENLFKALTAELSELNTKGINHWVIYCKTSNPSGIDIAVKAKEIADTSEIMFYIILDSEA